MKDIFQGAVGKIIIFVIGGFILALLVGECKEIRQTRNSVLRLEEHEKDKDKK